MERVDRYLRTVAAAAIRAVRTEAAYAKETHRLDTRGAVLRKRWNRVVAARQAMREAVNKPPDTPEG